MILAAVAALTLASCAKIDTFETKPVVDENIPVGFSTYTPRTLTKADEDYYVDGTTVTNLVSNTTFGVYGWAVTQTAVDPWTSPVVFTGSGAPGFMNNVPVTFKGGTTGSDGSVNVSAAGLYSAGNPIRYWPSGDKPDGLSFYAYYPANATGLTLPTNGLGATSFTAQLAAEDQIDFMVAPVVADQWYGHTNAGASYKGTVNFTFKHTLTKVRFYFKTDNTDANTTITLTNAQLKDVYKTNVLTTSYSNTGSTANGGTFSYNWGTATAAADFDITISGDTPSTTNRVLSTSETACTAADTFLMVPQTIADNSQKLTVTWTVSTAGVVTTNTKTIDLYDILDSSEGHITWEKNNQIAYTIIIGPKPIYFTAAVTGWDSETTGSISVN